MKNWLMPDYMFPTYDAVTPEFLKSIGVRAVLADIDNTLAPYEQAEPDDRLRGWLASLADAGISITFVSNNGRERVELFNRTLGLPAYYKSGKPFGKNLRRAMTAMGADKTTTVMLGDQLLTDALAGKHLGLRAIIVPPIRDRRDAFTRFKRVLERPFVRRYKQKNGVEW
jgi:HAD superfamily phosphatase (TIGR01668 family)